MSREAPALPADLDAYWQESRRLIDEALALRVPAPAASPPILRDALRHSLLAPGKRIRGVLLLATAQMLRGQRERALELAVVLEMVHAASLILDDLPQMDDATLRRGRPVLHVVVGEANAILAAVALLNGAYERLQQVDGLRDGLRRELSALLARAIGADGLIGGQIVDLESTGRKLDLEGLEFVHSHKTGSLFIAAAEMGALVSAARPRTVEALRRYAKNLGLAFQITDDLLDHGGDPERTGKDAGLDREKTTFVDFCGVDGARQLVDELIDAALSALSSLGSRAGLHRALAEFVRARDR